LVNECDLVAHQPVQAEVNVPIPDAEAYSFAAGNNELVWQVEVRIDIPLWPDWLEKKVLTVRPVLQPESGEDRTLPLEPSSEIADAGVEQRIAQAPPPTGPADEALWSDEKPLVPDTTTAFVPDDKIDEPPRPASLPEQTSRRPVESTSSEGKLLDIVDRLLSASRFGREREQLVQEVSHEAFECTVEVDRIERIFGYVEQERFRDGRTVHGVLAGTDCRVSVLMDAVHNEKLDACHPRDTVHATCKLLKWNSIYDRLDMQEA
jgi:hypothetical protein